MELRLNQPDKAKNTLQQCSGFVSKDGQHYTMLGTIEMEFGNISAARAALAAGALQYPGDQFLLQRWGTLEAKHGDIQKARELFQKSVTIQPHTPTFVAWAILEEETGMKALAPLPQAIADTLIESTSPAAGMYVFQEENDGIKSSASASSSRQQYTLDPSLATRESRAAAQTFAKQQIVKARLLYSVGMSTDPQHGPLYHAYGNMEMVIHMPSYMQIHMPCPHTCKYICHAIIHANTLVIHANTSIL
jgi:tetratricopeptide (TPR) repeat protein